MISFSAIVTRSQRTFPSHKKLLIRVKKSPVNPFNSSIFEKAILQMDSYSEYELYIHERDNYLTLTLKSSTISNVEGSKIQLDDKLWIELLFVFDFIKIVEEKEL